jgi:hypothetical protein
MLRLCRVNAKGGLMAGLGHGEIGWGAFLAEALEMQGSWNIIIERLDGTRSHCLPEHGRQPRHMDRHR